MFFLCFTNQIRFQSNIADLDRVMVAVSGSSAPQGAEPEQHNFQLLGGQWLTGENSFAKTKQQLWFIYRGGIPLCCQTISPKKRLSNTFPVAAVD